ncbi:hypothetical protein BLOT_015875 [Blomia tropicalis]|nr:hypothetical protein BLOT_015875 [Blomia tropicalis]
MFKFVVLSAFLAVSVNAYGNGGSSYGSSNYGSSYSQANYGPSNLAVVTQQRVNYVDTPNQGYAQPTTVNVESQAIPIVLNFRSASSPVQINHQHQASSGSFRQTESTDEAHRHLHTVTKPIIQEVREIIAPQRIVRQQVLPVQEQIQTVVARNQAASAGGAGGNGGNGGSSFGGLGGGNGGNGNGMGGGFALGGSSRGRGGNGNGGSFSFSGPSFGGARNGGGY